jgi:hypothetical protein
LTSGDVGPRLVIDAGGYSLLGSICTLLAAPGKLNLRGPALSLTPVVVASDGLTASYTQTGSDFTQGGLWEFMLRIKTADGQTLNSRKRKLYVFPRIGA